MAVSRDQARDMLKPRIWDYLESKGINPRKNFCCLNPEHTDTNPSMSLWQKTYQVHCHACGAFYDIFDLIGMEYGLTDNKEIFDKAYALYGITVDNSPRRERPEEVFSAESEYTHTHTDTHTEEQEPDYTAYYEACKKRLPETSYTRGLSPETLSHFNFGYDPEWRHPKLVAEGKNPPATPRLIVPTSASSYIARDTREQIPENQEGYKKLKAGRMHLFNPEALRDSSRPTFVVEGEIDAASIYDVGGSAVGIGSVSNKRLFLEELDRITRETGKPKQPIILALDNDERGRKCADELAEELKKRGLSFYRHNPSGSYKDANEALMKDREALAEEVKAAEGMVTQAEAEERAAYLSTSAGAHLQEFINGIAESATTEAIPTGFRNLDKVLDGGLYEGLISVGGMTSLGKTTLIMQIADQVAAAGNDVLIFSLEMSRTQLMSKSISRHTIQLASLRGLDPRNAKTARGITAGSRYANYNSVELQLIRDAATAYSEYADRVYIQEGIGEITVERIREAVERHILFTGGQWETDEKTGARRLRGGHRPLVIVDYLQIIAPHNDRATEKQVVDHAVLELKRISRDYKLPVIAISSFNRGGYKIEATFEQLKESGAIEYGSDIVLALQFRGAGGANFNPTTAKKKNPREVEMVVLKNRDGAVGAKLDFNYYPMFNLFSEMGVSG